MDEERCKRWMWEGSNCSICLDLFRDPVMLDCGHNFCKACITRCWKETHPRAVCPQCRKKIRFKRLKPNWQLASMVEVTRGLSDPEMGEEAGLRRKEQINWYLTAMRRKKENILLLKAENEKESEDLLVSICITDEEMKSHLELEKQMKEEKEKTKAAFRDLHQFLEEQEKLLLTQMLEVEYEIAMRRDRHLASLSVEVSSLDSLIQELEEKQKQSASEILKGLGNILERCPKESFKNPVAFPASLKWRIHDFSDINPFLEGIMKKFKDSLRSGLPLQEVHVTLDPGTAHPQLILSEDCKSLKWGTKHRALPDSPDRFDARCFVLGCDGFISGRYFWEVTVKRGNGWAMGIAKETVKRKGWFHLSPGEGIWAVERWAGRYHVCNSPGYTVLSLSQEVKRIRVTLNCAGGRVAFFDADTTAQIHAFSDASFSGEALFPFLYLNEGGHLCL